MDYQAAISHSMMVKFQIHFDQGFHINIQKLGGTNWLRGVEKRSEDMKL